MTDDRSLERAARSWIEVGPTRAPDHAVEAALARIQTTPQERDWFPWRLPHMLTPARVAVAAVLGALLIGGALFTLARPPAVGGPDPSGSPSPSPSPSASAEDPSPMPMAVPEAIRGDWQAEPAEIIRNVANPGEQIQLSLDWQTGATAWIQPPRGENVYESTSVAAPEDELAFVSAGSLVGCAPGDVGRYGWERSADGMFLTLTVISDACTTRAAAFGRTWAHSLSAVTDGGRGVIPWGGSRWFEATVPSMRFGLSGADRAYDLRTFEDGDPAIRFLVLQDPMGFDDPCATARTPVSIDRTTDGLVDYVRGLPGVSVTTEEGEIDGRPAVHLIVESTAVECPAGTINAFHPMQPTDDGEWGFAPGGTHSMWVVQDGADTFLFWYEGEGVTAADEQAVMDSIRFLDQLPTP
jgi:hypothetical protein